MFAHVLVTHNATGFGKWQTVMESGFESKAGGGIRKVPRDLPLNNGPMPNDVADKQVSCPSDCGCLWVDTSHLRINCKDRTTDPTSLSHEINDYLFSVASNLTALDVWLTPLTEIPESLCQLHGLTTLSRSENRLLTRLPDNCFTRLHKLQCFLAEQNGLTTLQDGLFDNLTNLMAVHILNNNISW